MNIELTPKQEVFIHARIRAGKYQSPQEVLDIALRLLDEYERAEDRWNEDIGEKIDAAVTVSKNTPPIDGETFVKGILERFKKERLT